MLYATQHFLLEGQRAEGKKTLLKLLQGFMEFALLCHTGKFGEFASFSGALKRENNTLHHRQSLLISLFLSFPVDNLG